MSSHERHTYIRHAGHEPELSSLSAVTFDNPGKSPIKDPMVPEL